MAHLVVKVIERCENANENANLGESFEKSMFISKMFIYGIKELVFCHLFKAFRYPKAVL